MPFLDPSSKGLPVLVVDDPLPPTINDFVWCIPTLREFLIYLFDPVMSAHSISNGGWLGLLILSMPVTFVLEKPGRNLSSNPNGFLESPPNSCYEEELLAF